MSTHGLWVVLTKTAHGKPYFIETSDPDLLRDHSTFRAQPFRAFGPYPVGLGGYESAAEGFSNDPDTPDLNDPETWFTDDDD